MMPYPDEWELDQYFFPWGTIVVTANEKKITTPEHLYECSRCRALVFDRKAHYFYHHPESKENK